MKKVYILFILFFLVAVTTYFVIKKDSNRLETKVLLKTNTGDVSGVLTMPKSLEKIPVALIISGSGPTDKDGNSSMTQNNSLKILASELSNNGIASLRYDKRGVGESKAAGKKEQDLRFEDYVGDAIGWVKQLKQDKRFSKVIVIGHSEGSLVGMMASHNADKFISIAGPGKPLDIVFKKQFRAQPKTIQDVAFAIIDTLKNGKTVDKVLPSLNSVFRPSVQPYLISLFHYDPQQEIKALSIPILIIQGTKDIQVSVEDAKRLAKGNSKGQLIFIDKMNHLFRIVDGDKQANFATYNDPALPIATDLVKKIRDFILKPD